MIEPVKGGCMARPRGFEIDDAEAALLDVFWSKGYEGSAVRDLCAATGQRPASLYAAFGDKDQMFQAAINRYVGWIEGHLTPPEDGRDGVRHVLETTCRLTVEDRQRRGCAIINAVAERENLSPEANATVQESFERLRELLRRQVHASFASAPPAGAEDMVNLLVAATVSIRRLGRAGAAPAELRSIAAGAEDAFTRGAG
jgi:TetR/AcrR family transcriptional repressor of nem operon